MGHRKGKLRVEWEDSIKTLEGYFRGVQYVGQGLELPTQAPLTAAITGNGEVRT